MIAKLRPIYNIFVAPLGKASASLGISPDAWTLFSLVCSVIGCVFLYLGEFWWGLLLIVVMFAADVMDGATARANGTPSPFGTIFDHVIDRYAEFFVIGGLVFGGWISSFVAMFVSSGIIMASYVHAKAELTGYVKDCAIGIAGRAEKLILTYGAVVMFGLRLYSWGVILLVVVGIISHITAVQRLLYAKSAIQLQFQK